MTSPDFATYIAGLPRVLAGAAALFRDGDGLVLLVEPNYREGWALPGGTVESDDETPRQGARRETAEEIGLDLELGPAARGRLGARDGATPAGRLPVRRRSPRRAGAQDDPAAGGGAAVRGGWCRGSWPSTCRAHLGRRVLAALDVLTEGGGTAELENGHRVG